MIDLDFPAGQGTKAYKDYIAALEALLDNEPTNPALLEIKEETGRVPVTQENVAIEARRKRGRISGETAAFPKLAAYIRSLRPTHGVSENTTQRLKTQADDLRLLDQRIVALRSQVAAAILREEEMRLDLEEARTDLARMQRRAE